MVLPVRVLTKLVNVRKGRGFGGRGAGKQRGFTFALRRRLVMVSWSGTDTGAGDARELTDGGIFEVVRVCVKVGRKEVEVRGGKDGGES